MTRRNLQFGVVGGRIVPRNRCRAGRRLFHLGCILRRPCGPLPLSTADITLDRANVFTCIAAA